MYFLYSKEEKLIFEMETQVKRRGKMKMKWTPEEDKLLSEIISWHGPCHWDGIALHLRGRNGKQCRERWVTALCPEIKKAEWTVEEDDTLLKMQYKLGNQWASIMKYLPGRSSIALKNRFKSLSRHGIRYSTSKYTPKTDKENESDEISSPTSAIESSTESDTQEQEFIPFEILAEDIKVTIPTIQTLDFALPMDKRIRLFN